MALSQANLTKKDKDSEFIKKRFIAFFLDAFFIFCFASTLLFLTIFTYGLFIIGFPIFLVANLIDTKNSIPASYTLIPSSIITAMIYYYLYIGVFCDFNSIGMRLTQLKTSSKIKQKKIKQFFFNWILFLPNLLNVHERFTKTKVTSPKLNLPNDKPSTIKRIQALSLDILILNIITTTLFAMVFKVNYGYDDIYQELQIATIILYYPLFETFFQATPGKALFDLNVLKEDKSKMNFWEANLRQLSKLTIPLTLGWAFIKAFWSKDKITLYDQLTKTRVFKCEYEEID